MSNKMIIDLDVFSLFMKDIIISNLYDTMIITIERYVIR